MMHPHARNTTSERKNKLTYEQFSSGVFIGCNNAFTVGFALKIGATNGEEKPGIARLMNV
jgi:hypothetical protein